MNRNLSIKHAIVYLKHKKPEIESAKDVLYILYLADLYHYIKYGRTIIENDKPSTYYRLSHVEIESVYKNINFKACHEKLIMLSKTDKNSIDFAILRYDTDPNKLLTDIQLIL